MTNGYYIDIIWRDGEAEIKTPPPGEFHTGLELLRHEADAILQDQRRLVQPLDEGFCRVWPEIFIGR